MADEQPQYDGEELQAAEHELEGAGTEDMVDGDAAAVREVLRLCWPASYVKLSVSRHISTRRRMQTQLGAPVLQGGRAVVAAMTVDCSGVHNSLAQPHCPACSLTRKQIACS